MSKEELRELIIEILQCIRLEDEQYKRDQADREMRNSPVFLRHQSIHDLLRQREDLKDLIIKCIQKKDPVKTTTSQYKSTIIGELASLIDEDALWLGYHFRSWSKAQELHGRIEWLPT